MIKELKIYNVGEKLRIGNQHDGGYIDDFGIFKIMESWQSG